MPTLYDGLPLKERLEARHRAREKNKESVRRHRAKVVAVEDNGGESVYVTVEWTRENGERLIAGFKSFMWVQAPSEVLRQFHEDSANPPVSWSGPRAPK